VPEEPWTQQRVDALALNYDTVENHGWYSNPDHTVEQIGEYARRGDILIDYSGGTGILAKRLLDRLGAREVGIIVVDSSPKFPRLALEKFREEPRMAFRRIRYLKDESRLERVDEVLGPAILARVAEWYEFLSVYHKRVLGWIGGAEKVTGAAAPEDVIGDRLEIMRTAMDRVFNNAFEFGASWTYITCELRA